MVKNRDIKGALATDQALREVVEKRVSHGIFIQTSFLFEFLIKSFVWENLFDLQVNDNEIVLCDLESRQVRQAML